MCDAERAFAVLERALELAQLHAVPEEAEPFARFVHGPLSEAARAGLEEGAARAIVEMLGPRGRPAANPAARMVVLACADEARAYAVRAALPESFEVRVALDLPALVEQVEGHLDRHLALVIDGSVPGLNGPLLSTLARLLPPSASLLFRGDPPSGLYAVGLAWTTLPEDASVEAVVQHLVGAPAALPRNGRRKVLVLVDPDPSIRTALGARFEAEGYVVVRCEHGLAALEASIDHEPDLLVAAREMPRIDGLALARLVRARMGDAAPTVLLRGAGQLDREDAKLARLVGEDELLDEVRELAPTGR